MKMGLWDTTEASMNYYAAMRTYNCKVSIKHTKNIVKFTFFYYYQKRE